MLELRFFVSSDEARGDFMNLKRRSFFSSTTTPSRRTYPRIFLVPSHDSNNDDIWIWNQHDAQGDYQG